MALNFHLIFIFFLLLLVSATTADECLSSIKLGDCGSPSDCNARCQSSYLGSVGNCNYNTPAIPTCVCCIHKTCNGNAGMCSAGGCNAPCQAKYPSPVTNGTCEEMPGTAISLCLCTYQC
ncbi:hypothetical protein vseg_004563 [Gypsophila vaccaria]